MNKTAIKTILFIATISFLSELRAQIIAPQSINNAGTKMTQNNGSISFTVGELVVLTETDSLGNSLGNGFTSSATSSTVVAIRKPDIKLLNIKVYPNPSSNLVFIDIIDTQIEWFYLDIYDLQGRRLSSEKHAGINNKIGLNIASLSAGTYLLKIEDNKKTVLATYKLIKK